MPFFLALVVLFSQETAADQVLSFRPAQSVESSNSISGFIELIDLSGGSNRMVVQVHGGESEMFRTPIGSRWLLRAHFAKHWLADGEFVAGQRQSYDVWRASSFRARLSTPAGVALPAVVTIRMEADPTRSRTGVPTAGETRCDIGEAGAMNCLVPQGEIDVSLRTEAFAPLYWWGLQIPATGFDAKTVPLKRGSSVSGWVHSRTVSLGKETRAKLAWKVPFNADPQTSGRLTSVSSETRAAPNGFFQITGVDPGQYELTVTHAKTADLRLFPVEILPDTETRIRHVLNLEDPIALIVRIEGGAAHDWPWKLRVDRLSEFGGTPRTVFDGPASSETTIDNQSPGRFLLRVAPESGDAWVSEEVVVTREDFIKEIQVGGIAVTGTVVRGDRPLATTLFFGGQNGAVRVITPSDTDGAFSTSLPHAGKWPVEIKLADGTVVEVEAQVDENGEDGAHIQLEIPTSRVEGIVLSSDGKPEARANVILSSDETTLITRTDDAGAFALAGVKPGRYQFRARASNNRQSRAEAVEVLRTDQEIGPVRLELRETRTIRGRVVYLNRAVVGANVILKGDRAYADQTVTTDMQGNFTMDVASERTSASVVVFPLAYALRVFEIALDERLVELNVSPEGGTLRLVWNRAARTQPPRIFQNGRELSVFDLLNWVRAQSAWSEEGASQDVPNVAPGHYKICRPQCEEVQLSVGGVVELKM